MSNRKVSNEKDVIPEYIPGVFCCTQEHRCRWQCFVLHQGLGWGAIPAQSDAWRKMHDVHCSGKLVQLIEPAAVRKKLMAGTQETEDV